MTQEEKIKLWQKYILDNIELLLKEKVISRQINIIKIERDYNINKIYFILSNEEINNENLGLIKKYFSKCAIKQTISRNIMINNVIYNSASVYAIECNLNISPFKSELKENNYFFIYLAVLFFFLSIFMISGIIQILLKKFF